MKTAVFLLAIVAYVRGDDCTSHVLTGSHAGTHGIGCVKDGCCDNKLQIAGLCAGGLVCCFTRDTCGSSSGSGQYTCHGDVTKIHPTGASARTASQDGLHVTGVQASQHMVDSDFAELSKRRTCYVQAGQKHCIHPAVIAGIASRETRGGTLLYSTGGWGDNHRAWGIMQCDLHASGLGSQCTQCGWDSCCHIEMMTRVILVPYVNQVKSKHSNWTPEQWLQGGVSAYNAGVGNVQTVAGMDKGTTGDDYSNDVIARAQWLISHHGW